MSTMPPVFSPDSRYIFYVLQDYKNNKSIAFVSDTGTGEIKKSRTYDHIGSVVFSSDKSWFVYLARKEDKYLVSISSFEGTAEEDKEGPVYDMVSDIILSSDGRYIVYIATKEGKSFLVVTDKKMSIQKEGQGYDRVWMPMFSPDNRFVLYGAQSGQEVGWKVETVE